MIYSEKKASAFSFRSAYTYNSLLRDCTLDDSRYEMPHNSKYRQISMDNIQSSEGDITEESFWSKITRKIIVFTCYLSVLVLLPISIWFCVKKVHALERLVVFRLGKLQPIVGPGFCFVLPFIDTPVKVDLNPKIYSLPRQQVITADRAIIDILAEIKYCVCHVTYFVTQLYKQEDTIKELVSCCLCNVICGKVQSDIENDKKLIASHVKAELNKTVINWGIEILDVTISEVKILKEAEQTNPLNSILHVFKSVATGSSNQGISNFIQPIYSNSCSAPTLNESTIEEPLIKLEENDVLVNKFKTIANELAKHISPSTMSTILLFKILDTNHDRNIFMTFHEGMAEVTENQNVFHEPNLSLTLNLNILDDLLNLRTSPMQAYIKGDIQINGDFSLLEIFENLNLST